MPVPPAKVSKPKKAKAAKQPTPSTKQQEVDPAVESPSPVKAVAAPIEQTVTPAAKPAAAAKPVKPAKPAPPPLTPEEEDARKKINRIQIGDTLMEFRGQHRQDQFLYELFFSEKRDGAFFECGALDGVYLSNTYAFERYFGWRGLLVEPLNQQYEQLAINRPQSVCLNACVGPKDEHVLFFNHKGGGLSGIVKEVGRRHIERLEFSYMNHPLAYQRNPDLLRLEWKPVIKTSRALTENGFTHIDLFSLDVEGGEYAVLQGIDFDEVEIDVFCIEVNPQSSREVDDLLKGRGYIDIATVGQDVIYVSGEFMRGQQERGINVSERLRASPVRHKPRI